MAHLLPLITGIDAVATAVRTPVRVMASSFTSVVVVIDEIFLRSSRKKRSQLALLILYLMPS